MPIRALGFLVLVLTGCGPIKARRDGTVVLASGADLETMNSVVTSHPLAKQVQRYALLTTLVRYDSSLTVEPYLARTWAWSEDHRVLTFSLVTGLRWHDGQPTTSRDVVFTLETARDSTTGYPRRTDLAGLLDVVALNDSVVRLRFTETQARIPDVLTDLAVVPWHLLRDVVPSQMRRARWNQRPIGNGPYRFLAHEANRRWVFEANPAFPRSLGGPPAIQRLVVAVVDEPTTKLAALVSGELDLAGIQPAHAEFVRRDDRLRVVDYPLLFSYAIVFNTRRPPFNELATRRAIGLAIDRLAIVSGYLFGFGVPASGPLPPELTAGTAVPPLFAPGRGRALIGDRPRAFELLTVGSGEAAMEQMIQQQLARIGLTVTIRQVELSAFLARVRSGHDFDAAVMGVSGDLQLGYLRSLAEVAGLAVAGQGPELVAAFRDSVPATFLYHARGVQGINRRLLGVRMDIRGELAGLAKWRLR